MKQDIIRGFATAFTAPKIVDITPIYAAFQIDNHDEYLIESMRKAPNDGLKQYDAARLTALQSQLKDNEYLYISKSGRWPGEYVARSEEYLWWISGFSGSAGACIIGKNRALLFTDGRYTIQAAKQSPHFEQIGIEDQSAISWLKDNTTDNDVLLFNAHALAYDSYQKMQSALSLSLKALYNFNLLNDLWQNRLPDPIGPIWHHRRKYAGVEVTEKIAYYQEKLSQESCDGYIITQPENIAWLLNIRGCDIADTPIPLTFAVVWQNGKVDWYVDKRRLTQKAIDDLADIVDFYAPEQLYQYDFSDYEMGYNLQTATVAIVDLLGNGAKALSDPALLPKAQKNITEQEGMKEAHIIDGVAMVKFLYWLETEVPKGNVTELDAANKINDLRQENNLCPTVSFESISAFGANAALPHYRVSAESNRLLSPDEIYLIDSGGQYVMGTTDITRTIKIGTATAEEKTAFTLVLKGLIQLFNTRFSGGTTGDKLDAIARQPLLDKGMNYNHGTGHGVGCYLGVHEGPQSISPRGSNVAIDANMVCSIEPGYYKEGHFGIRIENLAIVKSAYKQNHFCNLTYCPIDVRLIDVSMLSQIERDWLNDYHRKVRENLLYFVQGDRGVKDYLLRATRVI
ncbi:MAG: aminopeptidase P family protein [Alphaproteobacteria bacterium]